MEYGLQLYSVRDLAEKNLEKALRQVSALGYQFVEFAGFFGHSAEEVKRMLDENGLTVSGTHTKHSETPISSFRGAIIPPEKSWKRRLPL